MSSAKKPRTLNKPRSAVIDWGTLAEIFQNNRAVLRGMARTEKSAMNVVKKVEKEYINASLQEYNGIRNDKTKRAALTRYVKDLQNRSREFGSYMNDSQGDAYLFYDRQYSKLRKELEQARKAVKNLQNGQGTTFRPYLGAIALLKPANGNRTYNPLSQVIKDLNNDIQAELSALREYKESQFPMNMIQAKEKLIANKRNKLNKIIKNRRNAKIMRTMKFASARNT